jgi:hypothetical protein
MANQRGFPRRERDEMVPIPRIASDDGLKGASIPSVSCGGSVVVFVDEAAEPVVALDLARRW